MKSSILPILVTAATLTAAASALADGHDVTGPYAGVALGASALRADSSAADIDDDKHGSTFRLYGGYQFTDHLGAELGYARLGDATQTLTDGTTHTLRARSMYAAATGRMQLTQTISINGKLGMSFGEVDAKDLPSDASHATGRSRSVMAGIGAEYQPWDRLSLSISYDYFGKVSDELSASALTAGVRYRF